MDNKETFIAAIQECEGFIYKLASAYTNTDNDRRDLMQEITYQLWKSFHTFGEQSKVSTWIYRVALNVAVRQLKQSKKRVQTVAINEQVFSHTDSSSYDEDRWNLLRQQIETLGLLDKGIVMLYLEGKSHDKIAEVTGISKSNVGTRIQRIKEKLKQQITKQL